jgi:hypothetical protein
MRQIVLAKELIMDDSHSVSLSELPIAAGEKFTVMVMVMRDEVQPRQPRRKVFAHRFVVESIELPAREDLYAR